MLPISDALKSLQKDMNKQMFDRLVAYIKLTGFVKHDKCITRFFLLPIEDRPKFLDFSKSNWNSDSTRRNAISAVSSALDTPIIKNQFDQQQYSLLKKTIQECMASVSVSKPNTSQVAADEVPAQQNVDILTVIQDQPAIDNQAIEQSDDHTDFDRFDVIHKEVQQYAHSLANISKFANFVQDQNRILNDKIKQVELECNQLKEENKVLLKQLAIFSKSNNSMAIITSLQYSIDILLALYKDSCPSLKTYEAFEAIVRKQIDHQIQLLQPITTKHHS